MIITITNYDVMFISKQLKIPGSRDTNPINKSSRSFRDMLPTFLLKQKLNATIDTISKFQSGLTLSNGPVYHEFGYFLCTLFYILAQLLFCTPNVKQNLNYDDEFLVNL